MVQCRAGGLGRVADGSIKLVRHRCNQASSLATDGSTVQSTLRQSRLPTEGCYPRYSAVCSASSRPEYRRRGRRPRVAKVLSGERSRPLRLKCPTAQRPLSTRTAIAAATTTVLLLCGALGRAHAQPVPPGPRPSARSSRAKDDLAQAKLAYERGDYRAAIRLLRPLLYPNAQLSSEEQLLLGHKLLGLCYFFERHESAAEQEFSLLLVLRPDFALDPLLEPHKAVTFVDALRKRNAERLEAVRHRQAEEERLRHEEAESARRRAAEEARKTAPRVYVERVVERRFTPLALIPFGIPQLADRRYAPGALLLSGEVLTGAVSVATWLTVRFHYPDNTFPPQDYNSARALTGTYLGSGALFWGLVLTGLVDALLHARTAVHYRELPLPPPDYRISGPLGGHP